MKKIQHFVITRFNLKISGDFTRDKSGIATRSDDWLDHRFDLFERYCLPSLVAQTNQDFTWLLLFDESTSEKHRQRVERAVRLCPQIKACFIKGTDAQPSIRESINEDTEILITTRIDNDDAFRDDALAMVRSYAQELATDLCINFRYGFSFNGDEAEVFSQKYNPFSSLIELKKPDGFKTIFAAGHGKIHRLAKVKQIKTGPHWLMVVHDRNLANRMPGESSHYNLWKPRRLKRYIKKYLLHKLRRIFWSTDFKKKYSRDELVTRFHMVTDQKN